MQEYIKTETCHRKSLLEHFCCAQEEVSAHHLCCDVCALGCACEECDCDINMGPGENEDCNSHCNKKTREISEIQMAELRGKLTYLRRKIYKSRESYRDSVITCPTVFMAFHAEQIDQVVTNVKSIFCLSNVFKYVDIWHRNHAAAILEKNNKHNL